MTKNKYRCGVDNTKLGKSGLRDYIKYKKQTLSLFVKVDAIFCDKVQVSVSV